MKLEDQVCSLELAKKLKELGFKQESLFTWRDNGFNKNWHIRLSLELQDRLFSKEIFENISETANMKQYAAAYTVAELGEILRPYLGKSIFHGLDEELKQATFMLNEANSRAKMLIYLAENELLPPQK